jgi:hypothetical protein
MQGMSARCTQQACPYVHGVALWHGNAQELAQSV